MPGRLELEFAPLGTPAKGVLVLFCEDELKFGSAARRALAPTGDLVQRAAGADRFKGKNGSALDLVAPAGLEVPRLLIVGVGKARDLKARDFVKLGGAAMGRIPAATGVLRRPRRNTSLPLNQRPGAPGDGFLHPNPRPTRGTHQAR